jgi:hypothetical protein
MARAKRGRGGRFTKKNSARRRNKYKNAFNAKNAVISYVTLDALCRATMGTNLMVFLTERWDGKTDSRFDNSWELTLSELLNFGKITNMGMASGYTLPQAIKSNLRRHGVQAIGTIAGLKVGEKVLQKAGVFRNVNKVVRSIGLGQMVKV